MEVPPRIIQNQTIISIETYGDLGIPHENLQVKDLFVSFDQLPQANGYPGYPGYPPVNVYIDVEHPP